MLHVASLDEHETMETNEAEAESLQDTPELRQEIVEAAQKIIDLQQQRKAINADIQSEYEKLDARGIVKAAFKTTIKDLKYDQEQRDRYDQALNIARKAVGIPIQADLFNNG